MTPELKQYILNWLEKAEHDLLASRLIIDSQPLILDIACFHCQQAAEKFLKAFLAYKNEAFKKTHNLELLQSLCVKFDSDFSDFDFKELGAFAVQVRYPDFDSPELETVKEYLEIVKKVKELVCSKIKLD